jgi:Beta-ketoacyl synthase, N-terminal domain
MVTLTVRIEGIGLLGPGLEGWTSSSIATLEGRKPYVRQTTVVPIPDGLPPAERRRIGLVVKLALGAGLQATAAAGVTPDALPAVFASSGGDGQNCHEICQALANDEKLISPTRFHNSVHNAAAGYWSIATRSKAASNVVCAFDWSFAAGLLEAVTQVVVDQTRVLLVAYDVPYPQPLFAKRPIPEAFGVAFVLAPTAIANAPAAAPDSTQSHEATNAATTTQGRAATAGALLALWLDDASADRMGDAELEILRTSIPAARSLPLLQQLAARKAGVVNVEYLDGRSLAVEVTPCT